VAQTVALSVADITGGARTLVSRTTITSVPVYSALGVSAIMRYINRRFTYLLTK